MEAVSDGEVLDDGGNNEGQNENVEEIEDGMEANKTLEAFGNRDNDGCVSPQFEEWLGAMTEKFSQLSTKQKSTAFLYFLECSNAEEKYTIMSELSTILNRDIIVAVPVELREYICGMLDLQTLLKACCVSKKWNECVSALQSVWRVRCREFDIEDPDDDEDVDWKNRCIKCFKISRRIQDSSAFQHIDVKASVVTMEQITGLCCSGNFLVGTADNMVGIWHLQSYELVGLFSAPYRISCLHLPAPSLLVLGHSTGFISIWRMFNEGRGLQGELRRELRGHAGVVMSVSSLSSAGVIASGATDFAAKLWCLESGCLLRTFSAHSHWVIQTTLFPVSGSRDAFLMLTKTRDHVRVYSWPKGKEGQKCFCSKVHGADTEPSMVEVAMNPIMNFFTPGCLIYDNSIVYIKQNMVKEEELGNAEIVFHSMVEKGKTQSIYLGRKVRKLLAIGKTFALILLPHSQTSEHNLLIVNIKNGNVVGGCHLPHSSSSTPDLAQVVVGDTKWLDGLRQCKPGHLVVALGRVSGQVRVVSWRHFNEILT